ncbi:hypothetical protein L484_015144 [Morus notabilis]|uniref:Uncharacterized protein n=1 Tax=Morus notabilis TaxID=981085 RepID=W9SF01_9ROSA|nr:hypothetical protein L484_015144 [Morus notabilis]
MVPQNQNANGHNRQPERNQEDGGVVMSIGFAEDVQNEPQQAEIFDRVSNAAGTTISLRDKKCLAENDKEFAALGCLKMSSRE